MKNHFMTKPPLSLLMTFLFLMAAGAAFAQLDDIIHINEVLADPASDWNGDGSVDFKNDEWVEIMNNSTEPINLSNYYLRDDLGDEPHLKLFGVLDPGETVVFYGSDAVSWQTEMGMTTSGLSLNNGGDVIRLERSYEGPDGPAMELMFVVAYGDHEAEDDRSCGFNSTLSDWILFDNLNPYGGDLEPVGTGCLPSPASPNLCDDQVAVEGRSFGQVKVIFR